MEAVYLLRQLMERFGEDKTDLYGFYWFWTS